MDRKSKITVLKYISTILEKSRFGFLAKPITNTVASPYTTPVLLAVYLSFETFKSLLSWWKDEITGKRCIKQIIDSLGNAARTVGVGFPGGFFGGAILGPVGIVVGAVVGGAFVSNVSDNLIQ
ncbi:unnamed protein product [Brachionus calyciflorus]|uniref:Uncharacterized protein n=1 Tax=Brachionus calyciflorus TaxID=104777 RepID=A0A813MLP8_9BILA|nr:unnamed protein product [Brachionus calyciflorus]